MRPVSSPSFVLFLLAAAAFPLSPYLIPSVADQLLDLHAPPINSPLTGPTHFWSPGSGFSSRVRFLGSTGFLSSRFFLFPCRDPIVITSQTSGGRPQFRLPPPLLKVLPLPVKTRTLLSASSFPPPEYASSPERCSGPVPFQRLRREFPASSRTQTSPPAPPSRYPPSQSLRPQTRCVLETLLSNSKGDLFTLIRQCQAPPSPAPPA